MDTEGRRLKTDEINQAAQMMLRGVEAAAKAVYEHRFNRNHDRPWEQCGPNWRSMHRTDAAIAIAAASLVNDQVGATKGGDVNENRATDGAEG